MSKPMHVYTIPFGQLKVGDVFTIKLKGKAPQLFIKLPVKPETIYTMVCDSCHQHSSALGISRYGGYRVHFCHNIEVQITDKATSYNVGQYLAE